ncbi:hypothetical protein A9Z42_0079180 [Trichoderma parareesei]|uniref:Uncharacterized protein n=1 Tax=Trichoderma parareesei TaxID=858221 RepID=A0A2H3A2Y1_TRIPA|nr:hypothetical protein A9Z42_0079180 [Trichoderma parareesei]
MQRPVLAGAHGAGAAGAKQVEGTWEGAEQGFGRTVETREYFPQEQAYRDTRRLVAVTIGTAHRLRLSPDEWLPE